MLGKAASIAADEIVIDLEDAVAPSAKDGARAAALAALAGREWRAGALSVRVNPPRAEWCHRDIVALAGDSLPLVSIVVPKVESAGDLAFVDRLLDGVEAESGRPEPIGLQALIESAAGVARVAEIAGASERLEALIIGYADLGASLGRPPGTSSSPELWLHCQDAVLAAARANGLQAIDGPFLGVAADEPFRHAASWARDLGYDGKWSIHPSQVEPLNEIFTPSEAEVERAHAVIDALARTEAEGGGAVAVDGQMVDEAVRVGAQRVLLRAGRSGR